MLSVQLPEFLSAVTNISGCSSQQYRIHRRVDEQFTKARWRGAESACQEECGQNHSSWSEPQLIDPQPLFATSILRCRAQFLHIANVSSSGSELRRNVRPSATAAAAQLFTAVIRGTYSVQLYSCTAVRKLTVGAFPRLHVVAPSCTDSKT